MAERNHGRQRSVMVAKNQRVGGAAVAEERKNGRRKRHKTISGIPNNQGKSVKNRSERKEGLSVMLAMEQIGSRPVEKGGWLSRDHGAGAVGELCSCCVVLFSLSLSFFYSVLCDVIVISSTRYAPRSVVIFFCF